MSNKHILIGIAGGSGSGKTLVSNRIVEEYGPESVGVVLLDSYYKDLSHLSMDERRQVNFDHPDAFDVELLVTHLQALSRGETVEVPTYDYVNHNRRTETVTMPAPPIVVLEGILPFCFKRILKTLDIKLFVDTPDDIRLLRRIRRDMVQRGRTLEEILVQYEKDVRPMHLSFVEPSKREADLIIPRGGKNRIAIEIIRAMIEKLLRGEAVSGHSVLEAEAGR